MAFYSLFLLGRRTGVTPHALGARAARAQVSGQSTC